MEHWLINDRPLASSPTYPSRWMHHTSMFGFSIPCRHRVTVDYWSIGVLEGSFLLPMNPWCNPRKAVQTKVFIFQNNAILLHLFHWVPPDYFLPFRTTSLPNMYSSTVRILDALDFSRLYRNWICKLRLCPAPMATLSQPSTKDEIRPSSGKARAHVMPIIFLTCTHSSYRRSFSQDVGRRNSWTHPFVLTNSSLCVSRQSPLRLLNHAHSTYLLLQQVVSFQWSSRWIQWP